ncbi:MAG: hypothetical protein QOD10_1204 [Mycobacterium sp.]|jgi:uncharacterized membrane protein HdeD (DUF308 family)|nr:hypothetical protein [Mycobacterium sp.]
MTNVQPPQLLQHLWKSTIISGLLAVILGVVILAWPGKSIIVASVLLGIYLVMSGVAQVIFAFSLHVSAGSRILLFVSGAASLILAVLAFRHFGEGYAILLLGIWIGVGFVFRGVATTVTAISDPILPGRGWAIFFGVITIIAGVIVLAYPYDSLVTLTLVTGIWLIITGLFEIISGLMIRRDRDKVHDLRTPPPNA